MDLGKYLISILFYEYYLSFFSLLSSHMDKTPSSLWLLKTRVSLFEANTNPLPKLLKNVYPISFIAGLLYF